MPNSAGAVVAGPPARPAPSPAGRVLVVAAARNETSTRLAAAWRALGIETEIGAPLELRRRLRSGDVVLGRLDVLPTLDGVEPGLFELLELERCGVRVLNPARALLRTHDKLRTARVLEQAGLPCPRATHVLPGRRLSLLAPPVVVKPRFGSWGKDVVRCDTMEELDLCLAEIRTRSWFRRHGAVVQELIVPRGYDMRILVAGRRVVGAIERIAAPGEWRTNISLGGSRRPWHPSPDAAALAVRAAAAIGADFVGVDLLPLDGGYLVLELNGAVDFDGTYSLQNRDVYADACAGLELQDRSS